EAAQEEARKARAAQETARRLLYAADMQLAHAAWQTDNVARVVGLLDRHAGKGDGPDVRGFEWPYLRRLVHGQRLSLHWHAGRRPQGPGEAAAHVAVVALSADGKTVAVASQRRPIQLWDRASGQRLRTLAAPAAPVVALTFAEGDRALDAVLMRVGKGAAGFD